MGFADRAEKNLMSSKSSCKDFKPNIFNKTKCQNCFRTRESHTLDSNDSEKQKKVILCGYLYIAPGIDFTIPTHKGRKWQRRCFILYENGELCYALDDNPATIPQGHINMYTCVDISNSDELTGQMYSMSITTNEEIIYIRADTKEEKESWLEILGEYPEINREAARQNKRKKAVYPMTKEDLEDTNNSQNKESSGQTPEVIKQPLSKTESDVDKLKKEPPVKDISRSISCPPANNDTNPGKSFSDEIEKVKDENHNRSWSDGYGKTPIEKEVERWLEKRESLSRSVTSIDFEDLSSSDIDSDDDHCFKNDTYRSGSSRQSSLSSPSPRQESKKNNDARIKKRSLHGGKSTKLSRSASARHVRAEPEDPGTRLSRSCSAKSVPKEKDSPTKSDRQSNTCLHRNNNNVNDYAQSSRLKRWSNRHDSSSGLGSPRNHSPNQKSPVAESPALDSPIFDSPISDTSSQRGTPPHDTKRRNSLKLIEQGAVDSSIRISTEELDRIDASDKSKFKFNKSLLDGESPSPSRRTIERRRHAQERKNRHTLDGSLHIQLQEEPKLKRSNSDTNLSEADDMLKRKEIAMTFPGLFHLKKGWLIKQGESEQDWSKHWFVLCDNKLTYYKDQKAEENYSLSGVVELANCTEACSTTVSRNYGFEIRTPNYSIILAAMTSGIKNNWVQAINKAIATARNEAGKPSSSVAETDSSLQSAEVDGINGVEETVASVSEILEMSQPPSRKFLPDVDFMLGSSSSPNQEDGADTLDEVSQIDSDHEKDNLTHDSVKCSGITTEEEISKPIPYLSVKSRERKNKRRARSKTDDRMEKDIEQSMKAVKEGGILRSKSSSSINIGQRTPKESVKKVTIRTVESSPDTTLQEDQAAADTQQEELDIVKDSESSHLASPDNSIVELLETEVDSLKEQLTSTRTDLENSNKFNIELNAKIDELIRKHQNEMSEVMTEQSAYEKQLEKLRQKKSNLEEEKQRMVEELNQKEVEKVNLEKSNKAIINQELESLQNRCLQLSSQLEKSNEELTRNRSTMKSEREKVTDMIEKLNDRIDGLEEEVGDKKVLLQEAESQVTIKAKQVRELETLLRQSQSGQLINDLMAELTDTRSRLEESETVVIQNEERFEKRYLRLKEKLRAENNALKNQLQLAEEQLKVLANTDMLPLVTHNEVVGNLKNELELNESAKMSLQQKCTDLQNELAQIVLKTQGELGYVQSNDSAIRLEQDLEDAKGQLKFLKEALENEKTSGANLTVELENEKKNKTVLLKEIEELSEKLKQQEQSLVKETEKYDGESVIMDEIIQKEDSGLLNSKPSIESIELENIREQLNQSESEVKRLMELIHTKEKEKDSVVEKLNLTDKEFKELQKLYEKSIIDFDLERKDKNVFESQVVSLQKDLEKYKANAEEKSSKFIADLQQKDIETKAKNEEMQKIVDEMKEVANINAEKVKNLEKQILQKAEDLQLLEEQGKSKAEKFDRDAKKLRTELKEAQDSFDELELKHIQTKEDFKKMEKSQAEQILLMGSRIKDLTTKLAAAERKAPLEGELVAQQKLHRDLLEEQTSQYRKELEELRNKREKEIEEEAAATAKAISALKRVHNEELQRERLSVSEMMSDDVESVMKRHREVVNRMEKEWRILSEKYSSQCRENVNLQRTVKNLKQTMEELQAEKDEITKQNLEVTTRLEKDVEDLKTEMEKKDKDLDENDTIRMLQIHLRIKEIELKCSLDDMQKFKISNEATKTENNELIDHNKQLRNEQHIAQQRIDLLEFQVNALRSECGRVRTSGEGAAAPEGSIDCEEVFESPVSSPGQFDAKYNPWFPPDNERHPLDSSSSTQSDSSRFSSSKIEHV